MAVAPEKVAKMTTPDRINAPYGPGAALTPSAAAAPTEPFAVGRTRTPRTRRTVDLTPEQHRALDIWQREAADRLGVARVTGQQVLSTLVDELLHDPRLSAKITRAIAAQR